MPRSKKLVIILLCFLLGVFFAEKILSIVKFNELLIIGGVFLILGIINRKILLAVTFIIGILYFALSWPKIDENFIAFYNNPNEKRVLKGVICEEVDIRNDHIKLTLDAAEIQYDGIWRNVSGKVLLKVDRYPEFEYGDEVLVMGAFETPANFESFSYENYLARYDVYSVSYNSYVEVIGKEKGNFLLADIFKFKKKIENIINSIYPEPQASFLNGLLLGLRSQMPKHIMDDFNAAGLTHIVAISGYNITLIIVLISGLLKNFSRRIKIIIAIIIIILFTILVGASASVVRASIMGILTLIALWFGRKSQITTALVLTAFIMTLWNPKILVYDMGFQLSFAATCGLVYASPRLEKYSKWLPESFGVRESLLLTISAQIFALPIIMFGFGRISWISPISNLLAAPFIPLSMMFGAISVVLFPVFEFLGRLIGFGAWLMMEVVILVAGLCNW